MSDSLSPASSAYYHPRRPRPLRAGDRVRIVGELAYRPGTYGAPGGLRRNYLGAGNYGTVVFAGERYVDVRTDDLPLDHEPHSFTQEDLALL